MNEPLCKHQFSSHATIIPMQTAHGTIPLYVTHCVKCAHVVSTLIQPELPTQQPIALARQMPKG